MVAKHRIPHPNPLPQVMRARGASKKVLIATAVAGSALFIGCSASNLVRPEGDGGWGPQEREQEISRALTVRDAAEPSPAAAAVARTETLDLGTVLRLVRERRQRIAQRELQVAAAADRVGDVRGRLLPATYGSARYSWYSDTQSTSVKFPQAVLDQFQLQSAPAVKIRDAEAGVFNGTVLLPIDLSGELRHALRAAQAGYRGERARLWAVTLEQENAAVHAYFQLLEAQRLREVTNQTITQIRQQLTQTQSKFDNGRVTKNELLVVQVALRNLEQQLLQRDLALDQARWTLNQLTGRGIDSNTDVDDVRSPPEVPEVHELLQTMQQHNPLATALVEEQQRLDESVVALERSRLPRFSAGAAVDYTTSEIVQPQQIESGFVGLTLDLGTDLRREAQIAEARAACAKNRAPRKGLLQELEAAVRSVHGATLERLAALRTAEIAVGQADENLRIRQQQFDSGRIESDKVLEADALVQSQRAVAASALYQAHSRRAELQQLVGLPLNDLVSSVR